MSRASIVWPGFCLGLLLLPGCGPGSEQPSTEMSSQAILGGQLASTCQFPTTVLLSGCTGTLVHPQLVITAAHCGIGHKSVTFGEARTGTRKVAVEKCRRVGEGADAAFDYAYCKLATPVTDVPIAPPLMGCEVNQLAAGRPILLAGFGDADEAGGGFGRKRWVESVFNGTHRGAADVAGRGKGYCHGDSGGPAYVQLDDGSWRAFGIVSAGRSARCGAGDLIAFMHTAVPWIEQSAGLDISPCHDADGSWNPGPACGGFALDLGLAGRTWENGCAEPRLSPPATTCGPAYAALVDGDAARAHDAGAPAPVSALPMAPARAEAQPAGGCSLMSGARAEEGTALLAAVAFALAFFLRRRWFPRTAVVERPGKTHAGAHAD